jgi:hypothetical protein
MIEDRQRTIDIKDISNLESLARSNAQFDPEKDLTKNDFEFMLKDLNEKKDRKLIGKDGFFAQAARMKILFPQKVTDMKIDSSSVQYKAQKLIEEINNGNLGWDEVITTTSALKICYPPHDKILDHSFLANYWGNNEFKSWLNDVGYRKFAYQYARHVAILYPEKGKEFLTNNIARIYKKKYDSPDHLSASAKIFKSLVLLQNKVNLRLLFPEQFNYKKISDEDWNLFNESLGMLRQIIVENNYPEDVDNRSRNINIFTELAYNMTILAADAAHITENGLVVKFHKPKKDLVEKSLPNMRRF